MGKGYNWLVLNENNCIHQRFYFSLNSCSIQVVSLNVFMGRLFSLLFLLFFHLFTISFRKFLSTIFFFNFTLFLIYQKDNKELFERTKKLDENLCVIHPIFVNSNSFFSLFMNHDVFYAFFASFFAFARCLVFLISL